MTLSSSVLMILTIPLLLVNSFLTLPARQRRVYDSVTSGTSSNPRLSTDRSMNIGYLSDYYDYYENKEDKHRKDGLNDDEDKIEEEDVNVELKEGNEWDDEDEDERDLSDQTVIIDPIPESPNAIEKYVAVVIDGDFDQTGRSAKELFAFRKSFSNQMAHVRWARESNLRNETINERLGDLEVDVPFSHSLLSPDLQSEIGSLICLNAKSLASALDYLAKEPFICSMTPNLSHAQRMKYLKDAKTSALHRWMHVKEAKLRQDNGRFGFPTVGLGLDTRSKKNAALRTDLTREHYEYLIRSEKVIACGPLHPLNNNLHEDPQDVAYGSLILFNAASRGEAIQFVESDPLALNGVYKTLTVNQINNIDVSGKHVAMDKFATGPDDIVFEKMEEEGYAVYDYQTPWIQ